MIEHSDELIVSIWCMAYNQEQYLRQCLDGFVMQETNFRFEAIIHDDASTDATTAIIREYEEKYPDIIKPIYEKENQYSKYDDSLDRIMCDSCKGKYIAFCEGDDFWIDPYKLQKQVDILENFPECSVSFCKVMDVSKKGTKLNTFHPTGSSIHNGIIKIDEFLKYQYGKGEWVFQTSCYVMRRVFLDECVHSEFYKNHPTGDEPLVIEYLLRGNGYYINDVSSCYRVQSGGHTSMTKSNPELAISFQKRMIEAITVLDKNTKYQYHNYIKSRKLIGLFYIDYFQGNHLKLFAYKYWRLYSLLSKRTLLVMLLHVICPPLYRKLKKYKLSR